MVKLEKEIRKDQMNLHAARQIEQALDNLGRVTSRQMQDSEVERAYSVLLDECANALRAAGFCVFTPKQGIEYAEIQVGGETHTAHTL